MARRQDQQGFYKKVGDDILQLDLKTLRVPAAEEAALRLDRRDQGRRRRRRAACAACWPATTARPSWRARVLYETLVYAANRLGEIADDVVNIDRALRWGFGWELGPFETWDALGVKATAAKMEAAGFTVPGWVREQIAAQGEGMRFYRQDGARQAGAARQARRLHAGADRPARALARRRARRRRRGRANDSASLLDLGDGVFCLEFHSKMNAIDPDIVAMIDEGASTAPSATASALVVGNDAPDAFSRRRQPVRR